MLQRYQCDEALSRCAPFGALPPIQLRL